MVPAVPVLPAGGVAELHSHVIEPPVGGVPTTNALPLSRGAKIRVFSPAGATFVVYEIVT